MHTQKEAETFLLKSERNLDRRESQNSKPKTNLRSIKLYKKRKDRMQNKTLSLMQAWILQRK